MPGGWKRIDEGQFVMGIEENQAEETYSMCLEGATEISREKCPLPEELYRWSRKRLNAWLPTFYIMENEVTNAQYRRCVSEGPCEPPGKEPGDCSYESNVNCPVTEVTWVDAMTYCMWLDGRLPTEEEWEKAARGPSGNYFPWGSGWDLSIANLEVYTSGSAQSIENYAKDESFYGVKNLAGNVQEWTASEYVDFSVVMFENEDLPCELKDNAPTCDVDNSMDVVIRGGAWGNARSVGLGWSRYPSWPSARRKEIGFRCVCPSDELTCKSPWELQWRWFGEY
jgi:formylglycine-generating enzyme required for sulfatase activity